MAMIAPTTPSTDAPRRKAMNTARGETATLRDITRGTITRFSTFCRRIANARTD
jgi:hypothetical protein